MNTSILTERICTLHVCTSCRLAGTRGGPVETRSGFMLYRQLRQAFADSPLNRQVEVKPAKCLSLCPRPCGIALSMPGSWTYLFGDQSPNHTPSDVVQCVTNYLKSIDGFMAREKRPESLRRSILGRVPPLQTGQRCI